MIIKIIIIIINNKNHDDNDFTRDQLTACPQIAVESNIDRHGQLQHRPDSRIS